ncbi:MAG: FAD-dependent monooxygenase [Acidimicrobiales bacterium]|nr:FAD-dependent monooxygenase [Acidimicrobiales bacterium]
MRDTNGAVVEVVVVGGGIAGASLAGALAGAGRSVMVLEATETFTDRVRGESMMPWGVAEADRLGVGAILRGAGAHIAPLWRRYGESDVEPRDIPVGMLVPGIEGTLNLHHPTACQALLDGAAAAGAEVRRGVRDLSISQDGPEPFLSFTQGGDRHRLAAGLVVGADGRSSVVRRAIGVELDRLDATAAVVGLLLDGVDGPVDHDVVAEHDRGMSLVLHQGSGRARGYHVVPIEDRARYAGPDGAAAFLADLRDGPPRLAEMARAATPAGPCATFPNVQSWTDAPAVGSAVLIGDAAGQSDPSIGCGLSVAMRDARTMRDQILDGASTAADFAPYAAERVETMRRLRGIADVLVGASVLPGDDRAERRARFAEAMATMHPEVFPLVVGMFAGPETVPVELIDRGVPEVLRAA